ncbi:hypothetical protein LCGC14_1298040 [marine sediment metagenome]|uniref:Uncharacterized protein n=1 Tax=marine sediment metagenome TaxID=412755 RepID=A0A0F9KQR7_9ZZZZ
MDFLERNYKILEQRMVEQIEVILGYGQTLIDKEIKAGVLNVIVKPIIKSIYKYYSDKEVRVGKLEQLRITLDIAKALVNNGDSSKERFDKIIDENFPIYLKTDLTGRQCKENHENYQKLLEITKKSFISQVEEIILFLKVKKEKITDWDDLLRATFATKEIAYQALKRQLDYNEQGILIVEEDDSILKVLVGKKVILSVLIKGFDLVKKQLIEDLDSIFN